MRMVQILYAVSIVVFGTICSGCLGEREPSVAHRSAFYKNN